MTNYTRGRAIEYRVKNHLEGRGYYVFRTAGSHSLFDLLAFRSDVIRLIQVKSEKHRISAFEKAEMQSWLNTHQCNPLIYGHFAQPLKRGNKLTLQFFSSTGDKIDI